MLSKDKGSVSRWGQKGRSGYFAVFIMETASFFETVFLLKIQTFLQALSKEIRLGRASFDTAEKQARGSEAGGVFLFEIGYAMGGIDGSPARFIP